MRIIQTLFLCSLVLTSTPLMAQRVSPGTPVEELAQGDFVWEPEAAPGGPVVVLVSLNKQQAFVYRNGIEIGFAEIALLGGETTLPEGIHAVIEGFSDQESPLAPGHRMHRWMHVSTESANGSLEEDESFLADRVHIPPTFVQQIYDLLAPGTTLMITNRPATPETRSDSDFVIMATHQEKSVEG